MNIGMLHDNVLLDIAIEDTVTMSGSLYIPDNAQDAPQTALVIAVGPGRWVGDNWIPTTVQNGDKVIYPKYAGFSVIIDGKSYIVSRESELLAILSDEQSDSPDQQAG